MTCGYLMNEICTDPEVRMLLTEICNAVVQVLSTFNPLKNAPDGIHDVILFDSAAFKENEGEHSFYKYIINDSFIDINVVEIRNYYEHHAWSGRDISMGAMQKSFTMVQIANSFLPPVILNNKNYSDNSSKLIKKEKVERRKEIDFLPPNTFYVYAHVKNSSIDFILNKVIEVTLSNGKNQKSRFTVKEKGIPMESIVDSVCDHLLSHLQILGFDGDNNALFQRCCQHQLKDGLSIENYSSFWNHLKQLINTWVRIFGGIFVSLYVY